MRSAALALLVSFLFGVWASAAPAAVNSGTIVTNRGVAGIRLGMHRSTVIEKLGPPLGENDNGYMEYANRGNIFDLFLTAKKRVFKMNVSGRHFCLRSGICMHTRWGLKRIRDQFGDRLERITLEPSGDVYFFVEGHYRNRRVCTGFNFSTRPPRPRARLANITIGRFAPKYPSLCNLL